MIYINSQIEVGKVYKSHQEMYPALYAKNAYGSFLFTHFSIEIKDGDIYVQTDWKDTNLIHENLQWHLKHKLKTAKAKVQENLDIINAIEKVL